jgi:ParB family transcriptional regulator, chromosome partitioning protein
MEKRPALGKGLSALIPDAPEAQAAPRTPVEVDIDLIEPSDYQPRLHMDEARLDELAASIRSNGVIQPVVVRALEGKRYQIIAGERRWRAAQRAGLLKVPIVIKAVPKGGEKQLLEWALIENLQREDLNAIDEAKAYQRLVDEFRLTQDAIAQQVGKDRSSVANTLRLLKLAEEVQNDVASGALSMGHARALVAVPDHAAQRRLARDVVARGLSVREVEALVKRELEPPKPPAPPVRPAKDADTRAAEEQLHLALGARVEIVRKGKGGRVEIAFQDEDELQRIYEYLTER